jgi:D-3-phosphoglycerate dehydrogenase / 2-oxoglutarate reductase
MTAVAVTPRSFRQTQGAHLLRLEQSGVLVRYPTVDRPLSEPEMLELVEGCEAVIVGVEPVSAAVLDAGPIRVVVKYGSGLDNIDLDATSARGVTVVGTGRANARSVAELTIALMLALARHVVAHDRLIRSGSWSRRPGIELEGKRLGLVGYGAIGRTVARLAHGFGLVTVAHDPVLAEADVELVDLDELLTSTDVVSLHLPLDERTRGLVGTRELALMRPGALLINTARGGLVDEQALAEALRTGRLGGAAFDVFLEEPLPPDSPLLELDSFVASPHAGAATTEAARRASLLAVDLLLDAL